MGVGTGQRVVENFSCFRPNNIIREEQAVKVTLSDHSLKLVLS